MFEDFWKFQPLIIPKDQPTSLDFEPSLEEILYRYYDNYDIPHDKIEKYIEEYKKQINSFITSVESEWHY